ncbi:MAG: hypothetical protein KAJ50_11060 [Bacteroidales bacterium]|nr:hypothetical protein [Bacteroidales bacterium]
MKKQFHIVLLLIFAICLFTSCKKDNTDFYEYSSPTFAVFLKAGEPESIYAYCASHDVFMDSIYVTSPLNIKSRQYFHGQVYAMKQHFLMGNTFVPHAGTWQFIIYGRKTVNGMSFTVYTEREF